MIRLRLCAIQDPVASFLRRAARATMQSLHHTSETCYRYLGKLTENTHISVECRFWIMKILNYENWLKIHILSQTHLYIYPWQAKSFVWDACLSQPIRQYRRVGIPTACSDYKDHPQVIDRGYPLVGLCKYPLERAFAQCNEYVCRGM